METVDYSPLGLGLQLVVERRVPDTAESIRYAMEGDIDGLKRLFCEGLASPRDLSDSRGFSLIRWAFYGGMHHYKTVQFLLSWGAPVDKESYEHVWDYAYRRKCTSTELNELRCISFNASNTSMYGDWVEEQQFPRIHNIILGRCSRSLKSEIESNPHTVRATDAKGRTALDWATAVGLVSDMRLLIDHGSPVNTMDIDGRTTILHAVDSHNDEALRIIIEAGASLNPEVPNDRYRSSPLIAASFVGLLEMTKLLIQFGANVNACNLEGRTALQIAIDLQNIECVDVLIAHGADPGCISSNGL